MQNENFSTRDIYLSATLLSLKFSLLGLDMQLEGMRNQPVGYFLFQQTPELAEVERKYWARQIALEPIKFIENLYQLKSEVMDCVYRKPRIDGTSRDIYFAAALLTLRFNLKNIDFEISGPRKQLTGFFNFEKSSQLDKARENFLNRELAVEPILFVSNLRGLKSRLTNAYKNPHTSNNN